VTPVRLAPFAAEPLVSGLDLTATVERDGSVLRASYSLGGDLSTLIIAPPSTEPVRRDELWRTTCFELFAGPSGQPQYFEVNLSPSGDWQAYSFTSYREGMALLPVTRFTPLLSRFDRDSLQLGFELLPDPRFPLAHSLDIAITAVLEHRCGSKSYWALEHTGQRPDFHRRDSFILKSTR
jgi:hypothetical protein